MRINFHLQTLILNDFARIGILKNLYTVFGLLIYSAIMVFVIGCGADEDGASFINAYPSDNSTIDSDQIITVSFDNTPVAVNVELERPRNYLIYWELDGHKLTLWGHPKFSSGYNHIIIITWATGRKILNYTVPQIPQSRPDDGGIAVVAAFSSAEPVDGGSVPSNGSIRVTFDKNPGEVTASAGTVSGAGSLRTISGPFDVGSLTLEIIWTNGGGSQTLNYTVTETDKTPPEVASSDPQNGTENLDPAAVFEDGITVTFTESVRGSLALMDGDTDVGWISSTEGDTITLIGNAGQQLSNETQYTVMGTVEDAAGNLSEIEISFTTKAKN